ncbi:MAG: cysteine hydrolase [Saprospiraceae bacterium]|nr:cysteine hydrolase [Saprospiraceae bacterium]
MEKVNKNTAALVIIDPQVDFLSPQGSAWPVVGESVVENNTVEHLDQLFAAAKEVGLKVFISPHYYYPTDHEWKHKGTLEEVMHSLPMFDRKSALSLDGFEGSGADWLEQYKPYINDGETVICSPHKVYGPESNDLVLQLRKHGINRAILAGMSANLCVEAHMRELQEQGFITTVVYDATAGGKTPELGDGYAVAVVNFRFIANETVTTEKAVTAILSAE